MNDLTTAMSFRIATWNLERPRVGATAKHEGLLDKLKSVNADVWLFTESSKLISPGGGYSEAHSKHISN